MFVRETAISQNEAPFGGQPEQKGVSELRFRFKATQVIETAITAFLLEGGSGCDVRELEVGV